MPFSPAVLQDALAQALAAIGTSAAGAPPPGAALCVAYSGGLDSTVLLHAAGRLARTAPGWRLRAIHVDHRLQAHSADWAQRCAGVARSLGVEFQHMAVDVERGDPEGTEAAARRARYDALRSALRPQELLLTAHHADDQLETMLLALLRGSGLRGLSAMPAVQPFGAGWLVRPLLGMPRASLEAWAQRERLQWICDPSNEQTGFDRNYLRHRVLPALRERWPAAALSAARSAAHLSDAQAMLDELAAADLRAVSEGPCLRVDALRTLAPARRRLILRYWLRQAGVRAPSTRKLATLEHDMLRARADRVPTVELEGAQVRRHRGLLYCLSSRPVPPGTDAARDAASDAARDAARDAEEETEVGRNAQEEMEAGADAHLRAPARTSFEGAFEGALGWPVDHALELPDGLGRLRMQAAGRTGIDRGKPGIAAAKLSWPLQVRFRQGGESLRPAGDAHRRKLKKLLQSASVLPWWRERLPLVYSDGRLVAVGDLWIAQEFAAGEDEPALEILWEDRPAVQAIQR